MKKITALALSLIMILCAVCAFAEVAEKTEMGILNVGKAFSIRSKLPEGYTYMPVQATGLNMIGILSAGEGKPVITMSIAYNEEYNETERFNDVDEDTVQEIRDSFLEADPEVTFEDLETAYGTRLLKVTGDALSDADMQMLVDFISNMDFVPVE